MSDDRRSRKNRSWRHDFFARWEMLSQFWFGGGFALSAIVVLAVVSALLGSCEKDSANEVIIYTSQDQQFAEPILREFTKQTAIKVRAIYDSEAVKTVGLANRLLAEAGRPRCDVWWSNEALRTGQLARRGVLNTNLLVEFGFRSRRMVINTNKLPLIAAPKSLLELTNAEWRGKVALAYPMFGTASAHFIALRQHWGAANWEQWCRALANNKPFLVDGNSTVVKLVGRGEAEIGLTDFDDIKAGQREGLPIAMPPLNDETLLIPNSVAVVRGAPHTNEAQRLFQFLQSDGVHAQLVAAAALEGISSTDVRGLRFDSNAAVDELEATVEKLKQIFLR
jgi:iron(III) transport system substrate-binding protein